MKKFLALFSIVCNLSQAQNFKNAASVEQNWYSTHMKSFYPWMDKYTGTKKVKDIYIREVIKGKYLNAFTFNERGLPLREEYDSYPNGFRGKCSTVHEYTYDQNDNVTEVKNFNKKNELTYSQSWTYYTETQLSSRRTDVRGKPYQETEYTYNPDSTLAKNETFYFKKGQKKMSSFYQYSYYEDKKLKTSKFYKKNKLKHTWDYACDERGKMVKKDTTSICTSEGFDNRGRKIVTRYSTNTRNDVTKTVSYYLQVKGKDQLSEYQMFGIRKGKEVLVYTLHEPDSLESFQSIKTFNSKGRLSYESIITYSTYNVLTKTLKAKDLKFFDKHGNITYGRMETFDVKGIPLSCVASGKNGKEDIKIEYVFTGDAEFVINHYKKSRLKKSYKATISYY